MKKGGRPGQRGWIIRGVAALTAFAIVTLVAIAAFPFSLMKDLIATKIGERLGVHVIIGSIERREILSLTPTIIIHDIRVNQPSWVGKGTMLHARDIEVRISALPILIGRPIRPDVLIARGLNLALVRDQNGRTNWQGPKTGSSSDAGGGLSTLAIPDGHISIKDVKRSLSLVGTLTSDAKGLRLDAVGRFHDRPARVSFHGAKVAALKTYAPYPFQINMESPLLSVQAHGLMRGALNMRSMTLNMDAAATNLKNLDDMIEAGLFGTNPINLSAKIRHNGRDWFVDHLAGRIGRSPLRGKATILKREGRTKIDGDIIFAALDFDDLSDAHGRAKAKAIEARIGERVLPGTRINLAKVGPTDGVIHFRADRLLLKGSAFRSLAGLIRLDGKLLTIENMVAGLASGQMTGGLRIDQRGGAPHPRLSLDFRLAGDRLERLMGTEDARGPLRGRMILSGSGDTIREALAHADGRIGLIVQQGSIKRTAAAALGQDLGKMIGAALKDKDAQVPLRCLAVGLIAKRGVLTPAPLIIDTGISTGRGEGKMSLATEMIALSLNGRSRDPSGLRLTDPIAVGGTFSRPTVNISGNPADTKTGFGSVLEAVGKSIGQALGVSNDTKAKKITAPLAIDCPALAHRLL